MAHDSQIPANTDAWNDPQSLGFSTWKQHMATGPTARIPIVQRQKNGLETTYERHASFAARLISRQANQTGFDTEKLQFVYGLNRHRISRDGINHAQIAPRELMPMGLTASVGIASDNAATDHGTSAPSLASEDGHRRNTPVVHRRVAISEGGSTEPIALGRLITPLASNNALTSGRVVDSISPAGARGASFAIEPLGHIATNAVSSGSTQVAESPSGHPPAEARGYSHSSTETPQKSVLMRSFIPETTAESMHSKSGLLPSGTLPRSLAQRQPISRHQHSVDVEPGQRLPLKISSMAIARQSQANRADSATNMPSIPDWLLVNHRIPFKTISRRTLTDGRSQAAFAPPETAGHGRRDEPPSTPVDHGITQSYRTESSGTDNAHHILSRSIELSPAITATAGPAEPDAGLITQNIQSNMKVADVRLNAPSIRPMFGTVPIHRSALPQRSDGYSHSAPQEHQIWNKLPILRNHELQRVSQVTAPGTHASHFHAHSPDNPLTLHKTTIAQRTRSIAANYVAPAPDTAGTTSRMDQSLTLTEGRHVPFFNTPAHLTASIAGVQPAMQRSPVSLSPIAVRAAVAVTRVSRAASRSPSEGSTSIPGGYLLPQPWHRYNAPLASLQASTQSTHSLENLTVAASGIASTAPRADHFIGYANGFSSFTAPPLTIHRRERLMAGYTPTLATINYMQARAFPVIPSFRESTNPVQRSLGALSKWTSGSAERPLVIMQRAPAQFMRASGGTTGASAHSPYAAMPEDRYGVVPAPNEGSRQGSGALPGETSPTAVSPPGQPDSDEIAEHAWRMMAERLVIEQERRGLAKWP